MRDDARVRRRRYPHFPPLQLPDMQSNWVSHGLPLLLLAQQPLVQ
jgi:hypothetical protein